MKYEGITPKHAAVEGAPQSRKTESVPLTSPEEIQRARVEEAYRLDEVRDRLGLSRREVLLGAVAVSMVPESEVSARVTESIDRERMTEYEEGLMRLREFARTRDEEDSYLFIRSRTGETVWEQVQGGTRRGIGDSREASVAIMGASDRQFVEQMRERVRQGSYVELLHTHPTAVIAEGLRTEMAVDGITRVPPSSIDLFSMFGAEHGLTAEEKERLSFSVVSEEGRWEYENSPDAPLATALSEGAPYFALLSGAYARHAPAAARVIRDSLREMSGENREFMRTATPMLRSIERGTYPSYIQTNLNDFVFHAFMFGSLADDANIPDGARLYLRTLKDAYEAIDQKLRALDPDGMGLAESGASVPEISDASTNFGPYQEFWQRRGVTMTYTPFTE